MSFFIKDTKGLTIVEILVASVLLSIVVVAAYSTFIAASKFATFSRDELEAYTESSRWLQFVRTGPTPIQDIMI